MISCGFQAIEWIMDSYLHLNYTQVSYCNRSNSISDTLTNYYGSYCPFLTYIMLCEVGHPCRNDTFLVWSIELRKLIILYT